MNLHRACGRLDCSDCPKNKVGRCQATPRERSNHECSCCSKSTEATQNKK